MKIFKAFIELQKAFEDTIRLRGIYHGILNEDFINLSNLIYSMYISNFPKYFKILFY
jgi:hypothetical protein